MSSKTSHYQKLRKKWAKRHSEAKEALWQKHKDALDFAIEKFPAKEKLASSALGVLMLTSTIPASTVLASLAPEENDTNIETQKVDRTREMTSFFTVNVPEKPREFTEEEETKIADKLSEFYGFKVSAELEGKRLNRNYGYIGAEQHLMRFPGDTMVNHLDSEVRNNKVIYSSGMAPGRGAWGYFTKSSADLTEKDKEREKWYIAVQTFASPGFLDNVHEHYNWYKFRKMIVVNPKTGQAVVCDIGDAGPALWTGKSLGGSPEVMQELGLHKGPRKGGVLYFFVDDPEDKIPLGPIKAWGN